MVVQDNYFILHGSRDGDVWNFQGYQTYDRAHPINLANPTQEAKGFKSLLWIYGANHNHFNSVWATRGRPLPYPAPHQENVAKVYLSAIAQGTLLRRSQYLNLLKDFQFSQQQGSIPTPSGWSASTRITSACSSPITRRTASWRHPRRPSAGASTRPTSPRWSWSLIRGPAAISISRPGA